VRKKVGKISDLGQGDPIKSKFREKGRQKFLAQDQVGSIKSEFREENVVKNL